MALSQRRTALLKRLVRPRTRQREGLVLVEGIRGVGEALDASAATDFALVSPRLRALEGGAELEARLRHGGVAVEVAEDRELAELADTEQPQGVLVVCREPSPPGSLAGDGRYLVLDAIQDPGNVGTLVRAAVAFALDGVVALDGTADPWSSKAVRAATALTFRIPVWRLDAASALAALDVAGIGLLAADADGARVRGRAGGWALAIGNEGAGVRPSVRAHARESVKVPMPGPAESLNAGVAGAILVFAMTSEDGGA